nr:aminotransferase class I/II-fold pyridoxal phosphate-dependent enzyme [Serratia sp. PAMC26656]
EVLPLIGSKEGIMHISMAFLNEGDEVLIPNPGYPTYESVTKLVGATPVFYDLLAENDWCPDLIALEKSDLSKVK